MGGRAQRRALGTPNAAQRATRIAAPEFWPATGALHGDGGQRYACARAGGSEPDGVQQPTGRQDGGTRERVRAQLTTTSLLRRAGDA